MTNMGGLYTHEYLGNSQVALGFERGQIACVDVRMPRAEPCVLWHLTGQDTDEFR
jgi:hypothetical protein